MKKITEEMQDWNYDYDVLLSCFEYEIIAQADNEDYQGDTLVVFKNGTKYGLLLFGWGSCSGCDALQSCGTVEEANELKNSLHDDIKWFDTLKDLNNYVNGKDWDLTFYNKDLVTSIKEQLLKVGD